MKRGEFVSKTKKTGIDTRPFVADQVRRYIEDNPKAKETEFSAAGYVLNEVMRACEHVNRRKMLADFERSLSDDGRVSDYFENIVKSWGRRSDSGRRGHPRLAEDTFLWFFKYVEDTSYFTEIARHVWPNSSEIFMRFVYAKCGGEDDTDPKLATTRFKADIEEVRREFRNLWIPEALRAPMVPPPYVTKEHIKAAINREADDGIWLNPHNHHSIPLSGRKDEQRRLTDFMEDIRPFLICPLIAPSGAGKTRLVSEWMMPYVWTVSPTKWDAGILTSSGHDARNPELWKSPEEGGEWEIICDTLIVIDYTFAFDKVIRQIATRARAQDAHKIRILVVDHVFPESLINDFFWRNPYSSKGLVDTRRSDELLDPIELSGESADSALLCDVVAAVASSDNTVYLPDNPIIVQAVSQLFKMGSRIEMERGNPEAVRHPLFAALMGHAIRKGRDASEWTRRDLLDYYFSNDWKIPWRVWKDRDKTAKQQCELLNRGAKVAAIVCMATIYRGVDIPFVRSLMLGEAASEIIQYACRITSSEREDQLPPFSPDILGELFLLTFLSYLSDQEGMTDEFVRKYLVPPIENSFANCEDFLEVILRTARNLANEDQSEIQVKESWRALSSLLQPKRFPKNSTLRATTSCALVLIILQNADRLDKTIAGEFLQQVEIDSFVVQFDVVAYSASLAFAFYFELLTITETLPEDISSIVEGVCLAYERAASFQQSYLHFLTSLPNFQLTRFLISKPFCDLNANDGSGNTPLTMAISIPSLDAVDALLESPLCDPNKLNEAGGAPIHIAASTGNLAVMVRLIEDDRCDLNVTDKLGNTAFLTAAFFGKVNIIEVLLAEEKCDPLIRGKDDTCALIAAAQTGQNTVVQKLLEDDRFDVNSRTQDGATPLMAAAREGRTDVVKILLKDFACDPNLQKVDTGSTALHMACFQAETDAALLLVNDNRAKLDTQANDGATALFVASQERLVPIVEAILETRCFTTDMPRHDHTTPLMIASEKGFTHIVHLLLNEGKSDPNILRGGGISALMSACMHNRIDTVGEFLTCARTNINIAGQDGIFPLWFACFHHHVELVQILLSDDRCNPNMVDALGRTALHIAAYDGHDDIVALLLDHTKIDTMKQNANGFSALEVAASRSHTTIVKRIKRKRQSLSA